MGNNTELSDIKSIPDGFSPDSLNWITGPEKDMIALRRGTNLLGTTRSEDTDGITGLGVGTKDDGTQVPFFSYARKVKYYDSVTDDTAEVGTNLLPAAADGDEVSIAPYQNLAGTFVYISSINSSIYKIHVANPATALDQTGSNAGDNYRGVLKFGQSRAILFNRKGNSGVRDATGLYMSWVDKASVTSVAPFTSKSESFANPGVALFTCVLASVTSPNTCFLVAFSATVDDADPFATDPTETWSDDRMGNLVSNLGGTGTVNYATGAISATFSNVITSGVTVTYYLEDATSNGVIDFSFNATTRVTGTGRYFKQFDGGGPLNSVFPLGNVFYGFHTLKTWQTTIPSDDDDAGATASTNLPFREKMGVTYPYSAFGGAEAIYFINNSNPTQPEVYELRLFTGATAANIAAPTLISKPLNLSAYAFDKSVIFEWGNYVLLCFQQVRNGTTDAFNSRMFIYNKRSGTWDFLDYPASRLAEYAGTLIAGDPLSNNIFTLFSGFDDDGSIITNYWTSGQTNLKSPGQKVTNRMVVDGLIVASQNIEVSLSYDGGNFTKVFTIEGTGTYVDSGKSISVGSVTEGSKIVGGGATVFANPFEVEFPVNSAHYEYIRIKFEATGGGWAQINSYEFKDNRFKSLRVLPARLAAGAI